MTTQNIIKTLYNDNDALDIKVNYLTGDYELEEAIIELTNILNLSPKLSHLSNDAIMIFLHED
jgi:hypothetical protein